MTRDGKEVYVGDVLNIGGMDSPESRACVEYQTALKIMVANLQKKKRREKHRAKQLKVFARRGLVNKIMARNLIG